MLGRKHRKKDGDNVTTVSRLKRAHHQQPQLNYIIQTKISKQFAT